MNAPADIHDTVSNLKTKGEPFAVATVVRTVAVTSAKAGAKAVIMGDGTITEGWIGGGCARSAVLKAAREALEDGVPRLVSVQPEDLLEEQGIAPGDVKDGVKFTRNMCPSQGTMDIFIEAVRPRPEIVVLGASPVAVALAALAKPLGFSRTICADIDDHKQFTDAERFVDGFDVPSSQLTRFVVVSTQGRGDEAALKSAISSNAPYVSFVGSQKKAASLKTKLVENGMELTEFERLKAPAGLDIKAIAPEEIALSILAEIVQQRRSNEVVETLTVDRPDSAEMSKKDNSFLARITQRHITKTTTHHAAEANEVHPFLSMRCPFC